MEQNAHIISGFEAFFPMIQSTPTLSVPTPMTSILGHGIYSIPEAAEYLGVSAVKLRGWFQGWPQGAGPLLHGDYTVNQREPQRLSFLDLMEARVVLSLRAQASSQAVREAYAGLKKYLKVAHPLSHQSLLVDERGARFFLEAARDSGESELIELLRTPQHAMREVLGPLLKNVHYDRDTQLASRWEASPGVVLDPARHYGKPLVDNCGVPAAVLADAFKANGRDADRVATWYGVTAEDVRNAMRFRESFARAA